jgi:hypothetical protein
MRKDRLGEHSSLREIANPRMFPDAVAQSSLQARLRCGDEPEGLEFLKIFFCDLSLHHPDRVDVSKGRMVVMDGCHKGHVSADHALHLADGMPREMLYIQILVCVFFFCIEVDNDFEKKRAFRGVNQVIGVIFVTAFVPVEQLPRDRSPVFARPVDDIAEMLLNLYWVSGIFHFDNGHFDCSASTPML